MKAASTDICTSEYHLKKAAEHMTVAYWTKDDFHIKAAREAVVRALGFEDEDDLVASIGEQSAKAVLQRFE